MNKKTKVNKNNSELSKEVNFKKDRKFFKKILGISATFLFILFSGIIILNYLNNLLLF